METLIFKGIGEDPDPRHQSTRNNLVYFKITIVGIVAQPSFSMCTPVCLASEVGFIYILQCKLQVVICISFIKIEFEAETIFKLLMWQKMIEVVPSAIICRQLLAASCHEYYFSLYSTPDTFFPWKPVWRLKIPPRLLSSRGLQPQEDSDS